MTDHIFPLPSHHQSITINQPINQGFVVFDYAQRYAEAIEALSKMMANGELAWKTDIVEGLENAPGV